MFTHLENPHDYKIDNDWQILRQTSTDDQMMQLAILYFWLK